MTAFVLVFIFSADLPATEEWERELMDDGWIRVKEKLTDYADTTWYGQKGKQQNYEYRINYIDPSGKKTFYVHFKGAQEVHLGIREDKNDGTICIRIKSFHSEMQCNRTLWKKGDIQRKIGQMISWLDFPFVHVNGISHRLKRVKRNPKRKNQVKRNRIQMPTKYVCEREEIL